MACFTRTNTFVLSAKTGCDQPYPLETVVEFSSVAPCLPPVRYPPNFVMPPSRSVLGGVTGSAHHADDCALAEIVYPGILAPWALTI